MITKDLSREFIVFLDKFIKFYQEFIILEDEKYDAIMHNDIDRLDKCAVEEQVYILKSRGLENERENLINKTGHINATFKELLPFFHKDYSEQINIAYTTLSEIILELKSLNVRSNSLIELRLHKIKQTINKLENRSDFQVAYNKNAKESGTNSSLISKKI